MAGSRGVPGAGPSGWRLVLGRGTAGPELEARGAVNMAVDEALLGSVQRTGRPVLRLYTWSPACLSLGRNQRGRGVYDPARAGAAGIDIVRRPTGGLAVLHDRELTYSVVAPLAPLGGPRAAYVAVNAALVEGLRELGVAAEQAADGPVRGPVADSIEPCFQAPAAGEVVAAGRKLVGSAQRCERGVFLQHGSILLSGSQSRVLDFLTDRAAAPPAAEMSVTIGELLAAEPTLPALTRAITTGFERLFGTRLAPDTLDPEELERVRRLTTRYETNDWTWRR